MEVTDPSYYGTVTFGEPETVELAVAGEPQSNVTVTCAHGEWRPPERLARFLPEDFSVPLDCYTGSDGLRRIVPRCNLEELIDLGAVGGLAALHGIRGFDEEVDHSYRAMLLINQHVRGRAYRGTRGVKEHLTREFGFSRDLFVRPLGRRDHERDVLPDDVGLNAAGEGRRVSIAQLTETGRRAAQEAGVQNPTSRQAIAYGLFEAAKRNPLEVEAERVPTLVRMALFDTDAAAEVPSDEFMEIVTERLLDAIHRHLDGSQESFEGWFSGPSNSLVKQIAQQKSKRGGRLEREEVRQALLHLGWRAYEYVGQCIHALMWTIKNSMPDPLIDEERRLFEHMHECQAYYGNLPLALLGERVGFLQLAVRAIWDEPQNQDHVHVLHRLLAYYAEMARKRREADRRSKQRCNGGPPTPPKGDCVVDQASENYADMGRETQSPDKDRNASGGRRAGLVQLIENLHSPRSAEEDPFAKVAEHVRELHGIECEADCQRWDYTLEEESQESVTIGMRCQCGDVAGSIRIPRDEFAARAEEVL